MIKNIIERKMQLTQIYNLTGTNYVSLQDGGAGTCDNCGAILANVATVKGERDMKYYSIGFDCLDTFLINNNLLSGEDIEQYELAKKALPKIRKLHTRLKEVKAKNDFVVKVEIENSYNSGISYYFFNAAGKCVGNEYERCKHIHMPTLKAVLATIKNLEITYKENL